ncbi:predicted protein [Sclerotinia sclerotiorum 1980 UF-70]|uniref:Uncharacterized protein n=1 Tax=Sclerotinia sclerotiorum (strain ATCC 18683 / 1980 / Ss-1) TaxID=665079 RepID=A7EV13_SCLS1|nr:predicted protein [Sclerotinia sclerotiorum 1980 UF-70]EDN93305.1 predicted protein [Sclerotinia sclerotiorum 1980 UF-70]
MSQKRNHAEFSAGSSVTEEKTLVGAKSHAVAKRNKNRVAKRKPAIFMKMMTSHLTFSKQLRTRGSEILAKNFHVASMYTQTVIHAQARTKMVRVIGMARKIDDGYLS